MARRRKNGGSFKLQGGSFKMGAGARKKKRVRIALGGRHLTKIETLKFYNRLPKPRFSI